jgi:hypothetical protein
MIIKHYCIDNFTFLEAKFEEDDNKLANRLEGAGVQIELNTPIVFFNKKYNNLHPDVLGLACLAIFYPFIGKRVTLPLPVSTRLPEALSRPIFTKTKEIEITNIEPSLPAYKGNGSSVLAYGGGMDSTAIRALLPETFVVHEASIKKGIEALDHTNSIVSLLEEKGCGSLVKTNSRYLSNPGGWHIWIGSMVTALLEANARNASYINAGTILGSAFMSNGAKYFDRHNARKWHGPSGNYWQQLFWDIELPMVQPLMGCSEILTMEASLKQFNEDEIFFCTATNGRACGVCPKCFRRTAIKDHVLSHNSDYSAFDNPEIHNLLKKSPTYFGHIYSALMSEGWKPPVFLEKYFNHLPQDNTFALRYNPESIDFMPENLKQPIQKVLNDNFNPMDSTEIKQMKTWDQSRLTREA